MVGDIIISADFQAYNLIGLLPRAVSMIMES